ncbi:MAG: ferredoxin reductase, partial [Nocardioidaceae bacterium]|nr:ferredoxin reductase [Nocardioidaceae bacterium]
MSLTRTILRSPAVAALTSPHGVDRYLELVNPMWAAHEVRARVVRTHRETHDVTTLTLQPTSTWPGFAAGQHVQVGVEVDGTRHTRCFSISSSDLARRMRGDRTFTITVRAHDDGVVSKHLARHAGVGTVLHLSRAEGEFTLPPLLPRRLLFLSAGSGITPVMSMLRSLVDLRYEGRLTFVHHARTPEETIFADELDEIAQLPNVDVTVLHTRLGDKRLNELQLTALAPAYADTLTYACGPAGFVETVRELYAGRDTLRVEYFKTSTLPPDDEAATGTVRFARSGQTAANTGATLLEQAEALGLRPEHGCRMGICRGCTTRKTEGTVRHAVTGAESSAPDEDIQICVS